jgi:hypothetical protein
LNLDVEIPRGPDSVNSRHSLSSILGLQKPSKASGTILEALIFKVCHRRGIKLDEILKRGDHFKELSENNKIHRPNKGIFTHQKNQQLFKLFF